MAIGRDTWDLFLKIPTTLNTEEIKQIASFYSSSSYDNIYFEAKNKKIIPFVADVCSYLRLDKKLWDNIINDYKNRNLKIIKMLNDLFYQFHLNNCFSPCVTENFGVLLSLDQNIDCFCSGDVDISIDFEEIHSIKKVLKSMGFSKINRRNYKYPISEEEYLCPVKYLPQFYINIVWKPVVREKEFTLDQRRVSLWLKKQRRRSVSYKNTNIKILKPESMLIHCIYHISAGHYYTASPGIRLLSEIDRIIRYKNLNWNEIWNQARKLRIIKRLQITLVLTMKVFDTPSINMKSIETKGMMMDILVDSLYHEKNNVMVLREPDSIIEKLWIDVLSDYGNIRESLFNKIVFFIYWKVNSKRDKYVF